MPKHLVRAREERPWLDIVSYGRRGPQGPLRLRDYEQIARTCARVPEVMIKVTGGGRSVRAVQRSVSYFGREGELELETDDGQRLHGDGVAKALTDDWNLELDELQSQRLYSGLPGRRSPKLVHNLMFSMPPGTPPEKVLDAARKFARERFALQHRYAMVLHTDQKHPHVHMIVKAMSEQGVRLHITKPMLREWRHDFARYLRELGVAANATDRVARGVTRPQKPTGIYRAMMRGQSTHMQERVAAVGRELLKGGIVIEPSKARLLSTRKEIKRGWTIIAQQLASEGRIDLAAKVRAYVSGMAPPQTEKEWMAQRLMEQGRQKRPGERRLELGRVPTP